MQVVTLLAHRGAEVDAVASVRLEGVAARGGGRSRGCSAFLISCARGHHSVMRALQEAGADTTACDASRGIGAVWLAAAGGVTRPRGTGTGGAEAGAIMALAADGTPSPSTRTLELLLQMRLPLESCSRPGLLTPLGAACAMGELAAVRLLLAAGANARPRERRGAFPAHLAAGVRARASLMMRCACHLLAIC